MRIPNISPIFVIINFPTYMNRHLYKLLILISLNSFSQEFNSQISDGSFLFTFRELSYVISGDSIFSNPKGLRWIAKEHKLQINDFVFFQDNKKGYLMHNSGGIIYEFDGYNFKRIDNSFVFNNQYQSFPFLYKGTIYNFGGFGLFTFKNIITYFNESKKETELVYVKTPISEYPFGRKKMFAQLVGDNLFVGSGYGFNNKANGNNIGVIFKDFWVFDLVSKEWNQLGIGKSLTEDERYNLIYDFNGKNLVITADKIFTIDIKNNNIEYYENANFDLLKSSKKDVVRNLITYNKSKNGFYLVLDKPNLGNKLLFVSAEEFLGKPTRFESLYSVEDNSTSYYFLGGIFILVLVFILSKKKNTFKKIDSKIKEIKLILNEEETQIFNLIFDNHPEYIQFPELMDVFESHLSYESRKKKLRHSLYQIEDKIKVVLKTKKSIFIERKNKEDMRIKEIRIQ